MRKELIVCFISTIDLLADIFRVNTSAQFSLLKDKLMFRSPPIRLKGHIGTSNDKDLHIRS